MREDLALGLVVAVVGTFGTFIALVVIALFSAALRRVFPGKR